MGGRYGSVTDEGISFTEKEYNYAKSIGLPILAFVHAEPADIPFGKTEADEAGRKKLEAFRAKVMKDHPIKTWKGAADLGGNVSRSLTREIKISPRPGWIRNSGFSEVELLEQINALTKENISLREKIDTDHGDGVQIEDLESGDDPVQIGGTARFVPRNDQFYSRGELGGWQKLLTWDEIFKDIGPLLINEASDREIKHSLSGFGYVADDINLEEIELKEVELSMDYFGEIIVQLRALGLIDKGTKKRAVSDRSGYWALTQRGERYLVKLLARRRSNDKPHDQAEPSTSA